MRAFLYYLCLGTSMGMLLAYQARALTQEYRISVPPGSGREVTVSAYGPANQLVLSRSNSSYTLRCSVSDGTHTTTQDISN